LKYFPHGAKKQKNAILSLFSVAVMGQVQGSPKPEPVIPNFDLPREPTLHLTVDMLNAVLYGSCTYKEVRQASQECESLFFRHLIKEKCKSCSWVYVTLVLLRLC